MKKTIIIIACCSLTPFTLLAQDKRVSQKGGNAVVARLASVSGPATIEAPATGKVTLMPEDDMNALPVTSRLKPERVTQPTRSDFINYGKPVQPKPIDK